MRTSIGRRIAAAALALTATLGTTATVAVITATPAHACGGGGCALQR